MCISLLDRALLQGAPTEFCFYAHFSGTLRLTAGKKKDPPIVPDVVGARRVFTDRIHAKFHTMSTRSEQSNTRTLIAREPLGATLRLGY